MAHRIFVDALGVEWQVWAVIPTLATRELRHSPAESHAAVRQELLAGWLAFQADAERRRLAPIPKQWEQASDAELATLLERAAPVAERRRLIE